MRDIDGKNMNKWDLLSYMRKNRRYLSEREISKKTKSSQPTVHKKLKSLAKSRFLDVKVKKVYLGKYNKNRSVKHFRYKK